MLQKLKKFKNLFVKKLQNYENIKIFYNTFIKN